MEELQAKHRKEQRDLQARITQKKKNATKKTRKAVNDECDRLQQDLKAQQELEIAQLNGDAVATTTEDLDNLALGNDQEAAPANTVAKVVDVIAKPTPTPVPTQENNENTRSKKPNRQKARLARREAERAAQAEIAAEEAAKQTDHRGNEKETMEAAFKRLGLHEIEINPDGHCLYSAIACQLDSLGLGLRPDPARIVLQPSTLSRVDTVTSPKHDGYRAVRAVTADYITEHQDDFVPFMEDPVDEYVKKIRLTAEWGGQLELQAIARAYGVEINVLQGDGRVEKIEPGHTYGLGEHYNALAQNTVAA
ncbi:OTU-like cysteine protease, putative [Talaromyces stipitatus ATCC 10500]|uniref:OTU-like cysteine protease, putative n=1 Tax=Talaromyces stipitatus (strain ATCC 10500 / CBS 375.48 / QM 6759 / NRRL 1006) TaxID=441959 RepID=B8M9D7_TALSN|nr:OTU-like cysteine protease, putative [Talaromyces stipitatus ATCC 10500]EED17697.1 OTU-like cysteine protease, putative [Talaromyces stipitatus ATCC 10500]